MEKKNRFTAEKAVMDKTGSMVTVITDEETGVQYLLGMMPNVGSGLTVLVDKDGKPLCKE
jgi:hypothetical protein